MADPAIFHMVRLIVVAVIVTGGVNAEVIIAAKVDIIVGRIAIIINVNVEICIQIHIILLFNFLLLFLFKRNRLF